MNKIEFYKNRSLEDRISTSVEFIRQNGKVLYMMILIPAIPLALIQGYFGQGYFTSAFDFQHIGNPYEILYNAGAYGGISLLLGLIVQAITAAVMNGYQGGYLIKETKLKDLRSEIFSNMGKIFLVGLVIGLLVVGGAVLFSLLVVVLTMISKVLMIICIILLFIGVFVLAVPLSLAVFPALFQGASIGESIKKGFTLGYKNWGSTFLTILIAGAISGVVSYTFMLPNMIWSILHVNESWSVVSYILNTISAFAPAFVGPVSFIFLAFQYFSVTEQSEGISLQSKIEEFDKL